MTAFFDAAVILALLGPIVGQAGDGAAWGLVEAMPAAWLALVSPALVRSDVRHRRLPNGLTLPLVALVLLAATTSLLFGAAARDAVLALAVCVGSGVLGVIASRLAGVGMGDVKLGVGALGASALADPDSLLAVVVVTALSGAAAALVVSVGRRGARPATVPYGPCLLAGYWCGAVGSLGGAW